MAKKLQRFSQREFSDVVMELDSTHPRDLYQQCKTIRGLLLGLAADLGGVVHDHVVERDGLYRTAFDEVEDMMKRIERLRKGFAQVSKEEFDALVPKKSLGRRNLPRKKRSGP